jgi:hypothetical protein
MRKWSAQYVETDALALVRVTQGQDPTWVGRNSTEKEKDSGRIFSHPVAT